MPDSAADAPARLSVEDWVTAALELMAAEGIGAVKINRLCQRLGVTKGSFYWHFTDLDALLATLAERYGEGQDRTRQGLREHARADGRERLVRAMQAFVAQNLGGLDVAMRAWAQTDERARAAVEHSDQYLFSYVTKAFRDLGFDAADADLRAKTLYYSGVGFAVVGPLGRRRSASQIDALIELLTR